MTLSLAKLIFSATRTHEFDDSDGGWMEMSKKFIDLVLSHPPLTRHKCGSCLLAAESERQIDPLYPLCYLLGYRPSATRLY